MQKKIAERHIADQILGAVTVAATIFAVAHLVFVPLSTNDFWLQVKIGGMIWNDGKIPATVLFTFAEPRDFPFHAHEWLPSILFYLLYESLGYDNLIYIKGAIGLVIFWLCYRLAYRLTSHFPASLFLALVTMVMINYRFYMRPELFACLFLVILFNLIVEFKVTGKWKFLAWIVPLSLLWANSHGTFPVALVIMGIFATGEGIEAARALKSAPSNARLNGALRSARPYVICCAAMFAVSLVNPYGVNLYVFAWDFSQWELTKEYIYEWMPTFSDWFMGTRGFWAFVFGALLCAGAMFVYQKRLVATDVLLVIAFGYLSFDRCRHIVLFAFVALYVVARLIGDTGSAWKRLRMPCALLLLFTVGGTVIMVREGNLHEGFPYKVPSENFTPEMIGFLEKPEIHGNTLNSFGLGAELIQRYYPKLRPSIDSRIDAYGEQYFYDAAVRTFQDEKFLEGFVNKYDVRHMLLLWRNFNQIKDFSYLKAAGWKILYADHKTVLLGRGQSDGGK
jgi:hypothetical protein